MQLPPSGLVLQTAIADLKNLATPANLQSVPSLPAVITPSTSNRISSPPSLHNPLRTSSQPLLILFRDSNSLSSSRSINNGGTDGTHGLSPLNEGSKEVSFVIETNTAKTKLEARHIDDIELGEGVRFGESEDVVVFEFAGAGEGYETFVEAGCDGEGLGAFEVIS